MTPPGRTPSNEPSAVEVHFLAAQFVLSVVAGIGFAAWAAFGGAAVIDNALAPEWTTFFSTLVTLFGALFGFVITAASISVALVTDERMRAFVETKHYNDLWDTFLHATASLGIAAGVSLVGLVLAGDAPSHVPIVCTIFFVGVLATLSLGRVVWILNALPRVHAALVKAKS